MIKNLKEIIRKILLAKEKPLFFYKKN